MPIETVVFMMMENRTFDHYFGALSLVEGRTEVDGLTAEMENRYPDGTPVSPFPLDEFCVCDPPHTWNPSHRQFNGGANDGFVREHLDANGSPEHARQAMGYFDRARIPFYYGLAEEFVLCQRWFASVMSATIQNRFYFHAGTVNGARSGLPEDTNLATLYDRLDARGLTWKYYYTDLPYLAVLFARIPDLAPRMRPIAEYFEDAERGTLPHLAVVDPSFALIDDHPPHHVQLGQSLVSSVFHALAMGPQWERSAFILTYDEHGGFFDHVPPPKVEDDLAAEGFDQLGFRVPSIVAGPYARRGAVSNTVYDHTSVHRFLNWLWDLEPLTLRSATANSILDTFDAARVLAREPRAVPALPEVIVSEDHLRLSCVLGFECDFSIDILNLADRGRIPRSLDLRPRLWSVYGRVLAELERRG
ncbi:MAG: alkaline phosphatase family protein, partial [Candidatus Methylomirabilis sp.]|nr:alkaline phosphatase family protein [Deltaproteobacteria bacterium]